MFNEITCTPTNDNRSYHVFSEKIKKELGYTPKRTIKDAVVGIVNAFQQGRIPNAMSDIRYSNINVFQALKLK